MFPTIEDLRLWADALEGVEQVLAPRFGRAEPRQRAMRYLRGLLSSVERKNGWHLAELAGETTPDGMQRLLNTAHWDAAQVRDDLQAYIVAHLGNPQAVLVVDETGFLKKGKKSAGVAPQYSGTAGKIANCQIGVFLAYATAAGPVLLDRELYVPKEWSADRVRCQEAGIPDEQGTVPKPTLAKQMLDRAFAHGIQAAWVTGDTVYGGDAKLRAWLEARQQPYVLAVPSKQQVGLAASAEQVAARWQTTAWHRLSAGAGSQGPRWYDWAWQTLEFRWLPADWQHWLLARRSISQPDEIAYYVVFAPAGVTLLEVVRAAGTRWQVEEGFELAKQEVGLDEYEVRHWQGWYRHITLAMFALAFLTVIKAEARNKGQFSTKERPKT
jgi:SRSO17 transposase